MQKVSHLTRLDRSGETLGDRPRGKQSTNSRRKRAQSEFHQAEDEILATERMNHDERVNVEVASPLTSTELERSPKMGLVQRVISTVLYGNGANKQVNLNF